jgi:amino acid transporter
MSSSTPPPAGTPAPADAEEPPSPWARARRFLVGAPRDLKDRSILHRLALVPFLAWVGLGADGLSSSSYGPQEAFGALGTHRYLAVLLALATTVTVLVIAFAYGRIIEAFPQGGGGFVVATKLLGPGFGLVSGAALLVDYVLTITTSIAAAGDALFSMMPAEWHAAKLPVEAGLILGMTLLNVRGVRESIVPLVPVFLLFLLTHVVLIGGGIAVHLTGLPAVARSVAHELRGGVAALGVGGVLLLAARAYSLGGGTYTGIEAVSNGLPILREPRVGNGKRTMRYMAVSLAATASGLLLCYLLAGVSIVPGKTLNAVLAQHLGAALPLGGVFVAATLASEGALLVVAAQAGFIDGPRVLANMAQEGWAPRRFASLSERLTAENGILLMGAGSLAALLYTRGEVGHLVVMYSINVFITFSLSMAAMLRSTLRARRQTPNWPRRAALFATGLGLTGTILAVTTYEKFSEGGWLTLVVTALLVAAALLVKRHYRGVARRLSALDAELAAEPAGEPAAARGFDPKAPVAVLLVGGYGGLGVHLTMSVLQSFGDHFRNLVFVSVGAVDSTALRSESEIEAVEVRTREALDRYVAFATRLGLAATHRSGVGTDVVEALEHVCTAVGKEMPRATFFAGQIVFQRERWYHGLLHNQTAYDLQKRLQWAGRTMVIMPVRLR